MIILRVKKMMLFRFGALLVASLLVSINAAAQSSNFSKLVVFGDSLSDTGNLAIINFPPPYFQNRVSDGPVAADLIAAAIGRNADASGHLLGRVGGYNYAVAGGNIVGSDRADLAQQVSAYLGRTNNQADPDALYLVFAGGNDLRDLRSTAVAEASAPAAEVAATLRTQLDRLKDAGARAFLIPNVANIGRLPETLEREGEDPEIVVRAESNTREYNRALTTVISQFSLDQAIVVSTFDLFNALENLIENASDFGFVNTREGCFDADERRVEPECLLLGFESRIFFDSLHPSSASNRIIAAQMIQALPILPVDVRPTIIIAPILDLLLSD